MPGQAAIALSLMLHELATNAAKYGALSTPNGRVSVRWAALDAAQIELVWTEDGGPLVPKPTRQGFGTRLLELSAAQLGGTVTTEYAETGLRSRIRFPLRAIM